MSTESSALAGSPADGPLERVRKAVALAVMLSGAILTALIFTALAPVVTEIAKHYSTTPGGSLIGMFIVTAPGLGVIVGGLTGGIVVDRFGRKRMLLVALAVFAVSGSSILYLDVPWALLLSRAVLGWSGATAQAAVIGLISSVFAEPRRSRMIGYEAAIGTFAAILSVWSAGQLAEHWGWRAPAALYLFGLVLFVAAALAIPKSADTPRAAPVAGDAASPVFVAFLKRMAPFYLLIPFFYACNYLLSIQMGFLLSAIGVIGPVAKSHVMMVGVIAGVPGAASTGFIRQRFGEARLFALLCVLMGAGFSVLGLAHTSTMAMIGGGIAGLGSGMLMPTLMAIAMSRSADALRSRAAGLVYAMAYLGEFLNPLVFGAMGAALGIHGVYRSVGIALPIVAVSVFILSRLAGFQRLTAVPEAEAETKAAVP